MPKKFLSILILSLIIQSLTLRTLKEEPSKEEEESCEKQEETTDFSKVPESQIRKENLPHSQVLMPIRRIGTSNMEIGQGPCGGVEKIS